MTNFSTQQINRFGWRVANNVSILLAYWDRNQICQFANDAYYEWLGVHPHQMIDKMSILDLLGPALYELQQPYIEEALKGHVQSFERTIRLVSGKVAYCIVTYYPDIVYGDVLGFVVHTVDITPTKKLEEKLAWMEKDRNRTVLKSIIETQEKEREAVAVQLRDSVSQTITYCKMMLQSADKEIRENKTIIEVSSALHQAVQELHILSYKLTPSSVELFGLMSGISDYIDHYRKEFNHTARFSCKNEAEIETLPMPDKISLFRIVQDFLILTSDGRFTGYVQLSIDFKYPQVTIHFVHPDPAFEMNENSVEFTNIRNRISYYDGSLTASFGENGYQLLITLNMSGSNVKKKGIFD